MKLTYPIVIPVLIATVTTVLTTSFTTYLLARPWCIQLNSDQSHQIRYGKDNCLYQQLSISSSSKPSSSKAARNRTFQ